MLDAPSPFKELFLFFLTGSKTDPRRFKNVIELNKVSKTSHIDTSVHHHPRNLLSEKLDREFVLLKGQPIIMKEKNVFSG